MNVRKKIENNIAVLYLDGKIDIDCAIFVEETGRLLDEGHAKILCNFKDVELIDYNGLSIVAIAYKNILNKNGIAKFSNVPIHIKELFKVVRLDLVFDIYDSDEDAIRSFEVSTKIDKLSLRRRFKRLESHLPVMYNLKTSSGRVMMSGKVLNISGDGLFIYSKSIFPVSSRLNLMLRLIENEKEININGIVIWLADKDLQLHCYPGMGVEFVDEDHETQKKIIEYIDKNIIYRSNDN